MSQFNRASGSRLPETDWLGAAEITSFDGTLANDNGPGQQRSRPRARSKANWALPAAAFASGLTAALVVSGLGEWFGFAG